MPARGFNVPETAATRRETPAGTGPSFLYHGKRVADIPEGTRLWDRFIEDHGFEPREAAQINGWRP